MDWEFSQYTLDWECRKETNQVIAHDLLEYLSVELLVLMWMNNDSLGHAS